MRVPFTPITSNPIDQERSTSSNDTTKAPKLVVEKFYTKLSTIEDWLGQWSDESITLGAPNSTETGRTWQPGLLERMIAKGMDISSMESNHLNRDIFTTLGISHGWIVLDDPNAGLLEAVATITNRHDWLILPNSSHLSVPCFDQLHSQTETLPAFIIELSDMRNLSPSTMSQLPFLHVRWKAEGVQSSTSFTDPRAWTLHSIISRAKLGKKVRLQLIDCLFAQGFEIQTDTCEPGHEAALPWRVCIEQWIKNLSTQLLAEHKEHVFWMCERTLEICLAWRYMIIRRGNCLEISKLAKISTESYGSWTCQHIVSMFCALFDCLLRNALTFNVDVTEEGFYRSLDRMILFSLAWSFSIGGNSRFRVMLASVLEAIFKNTDVWPSGTQSSSIGLFDFYLELPTAEFVPWNDLLISSQSDNYSLHSLAAINNAASGFMFDRNLPKFSRNLNKVAKDANVDYKNRHLTQDGIQDFTNSNSVTMDHLWIPTRHVIPLQYIAELLTSFGYPVLFLPCENGIGATSLVTSSLLGTSSILPQTLSAPVTNLGALRFHGKTAHSVTESVHTMKSSMSPPSFEENKPLEPQSWLAANTWRIIGLRVADKSNSWREVHCRVSKELTLRSVAQTNASTLRSSSPTRKSSPIPREYVRNSPNHISSLQDAQTLMKGVFPCRKISFSLPNRLDTNRCGPSCRPHPFLDSNAYKLVKAPDHYVKAEKSVSDMAYRREEDERSRTGSRIRTESSVDQYWQDATMMTDWMLTSDDIHEDEQKVYMPRDGKVLAIFIDDLSLDTIFYDSIEGKDTFSDARRHLSILEWCREFLECSRIPLTCNLSRLKEGGKIPKSWQAEKILVTSTMKTGSFSQSHAIPELNRALRHFFFVYLTKMKDQDFINYFQQLCKASLQPYSVHISESLNFKLEKYLKIVALCIVKVCNSVESLALYNLSALHCANRFTKGLSYFQFAYLSQSPNDLDGLIAFELRRSLSVESFI